ncbi:MULTISPECIES: hypothetical protein [unclassified Paenibacillus]|uniref:hypothetical protein n=1 Tax=unclassified Paenibacillus TaxID=185978 RepID=UPI0036409521
MKPFEKKILTGAIAASLLLGGAGLLSQANAENATTGSTDSKIGTKAAAKGERGVHQVPGFRGGNILDETATLLSLDKNAVFDALKEGKSLLQLAEANGLTKEVYLQKLTDAEKTAIAAAVTAGKITQAQADKETAALAERLQKDIERAGFGKPGEGPKGGFPGGPGRPGGPGKDGGFHGSNILKETATLLGVEQSVVNDALKAGKTLSQFAQEKGVSEADYLQKLTDAQNKAIADAVTAGKLTQEQADKVKTGMADRLKKEVTSTKPMGDGKAGFGGKPGFGMGGFGNAEALAKSLGLTEQELQTGLKAGKSLVEIAQEKGISEDQLITKIKDGLTEHIKQFVEQKRQPRNETTK